jgi:hypothetical protein
MPAHAHQTHLSTIDSLTRDLWDGLISEDRFTDCALHEGLSVEQIDAILEEIRAEDLA